MTQYIKIFKSEEQAFQLMVAKNRACKRAGNLKDIFVLVDGPENDFAVMDLDSAIENGFLFQWSY